MKKRMPQYLYVEKVEGELVNNEDLEEEKPEEE